MKGQPVEYAAWAPASSSGTSRDAGTVLSPGGPLTALRLWNSFESAAPPSALRLESAGTYRIGVGVMGGPR
jgi:hypothetical protein